MQGNTIKRTEREFVETLENLCEPLENNGETGLWDKRYHTKSGLENMLLLIRIPIIRRE